MRSLVALLTHILLLAGYTHLSAQQDCIASGNERKLAYLVPALYGNCGLVLPNEFHKAHFTSAFQESFTPLNTAVASQLAVLPIVSPASGFIYNFDTALGVYTRSSQSFGPVFAERAETVGRHRLFLGASYQFFKFDSVDGVDLGNLPVVFGHSTGTGPPQNPTPEYEEDYIATNNSIDLKIHQVTAFVTFGLTDRIDISAAIPFVNARLGIISDANLHRIAAPDPVFGQAHYFEASDPAGSVFSVFSDGGNAQGIGDVTLRVKGSVYRGETSGLAFAADVRFPTGDEYNLLGSGAWGVKPFIAGSARVGRFAPHVNVGFAYNGKTPLAANISTGEKRRLPNQFLYTVGGDIGVSRRVTAALDLLGQRIFNGERVFRSTFTAADNSSAPTLFLKRESYSTVDGAAGVKINLLDRLLLNANVLFRLNDSGLRTKVSPLIGLSYTL